MSKSLIGRFVQFVGGLEDEAGKSLDGVMGYVIAASWNGEDGHTYEVAIDGGHHVAYVEEKNLTRADVYEQPAAPDGDPAAGDIPNVAEGLAAQIVHAQMVLQDALGWKENDYHVSLTDLSEDIEALKAENNALREASLKVIEDCKAVGFEPFHLHQLEALVANVQARE